MKNKNIKDKDIEGIKAKPLKWVKVKPPECFEDWSHNAKIEVLKLNNESAYYQVHQMHGYEIRASFWCGNKGMDIGDSFKEYSSLREAKNACQNHYDRVIKENIDKEILSKLKENEIVLAEGRVEYNEIADSHIIDCLEIHADNNVTYKKFMRLENQKIRLKAEVIEDD
ncbi:MAG: hypothetical protein PVJ67_04125 [Candidatus Pacearchaeota archaeon]|jgi:hypothetical protein